MHTRRTDGLRHHRVSIPGSKYFLTCCLSSHMTGLTTSMASHAIQKVFDRLTLDDNWHLLAATIMPDHIHVLFELGKTLSLNRIVAKLKTCSAIETLQWQSNYFEHRLRPDDQEGFYARYVFLNPYRAGLVQRLEKWPHWIVGVDGGNWDFIAGLEGGGFPPPEWLSQKEDIDSACVGESLP